MIRRLPHRLATAPLPVRMTGLLLAAGLVFAASSLRFRGGHGGFTPGFLFNLGHVPLYAFLTLQAAVVAGPGAGKRPRVLLGILAGVLAAGFLDEWHQSTVPGRDATWLDLASDGLGAVLALALVARGAHNATLQERLHLLAFGAVVALMWGFLAIAHPGAAPLFP